MKRQIWNAFYAVVMLLWAVWTIHWRIASANANRCIDNCEREIAGGNYERAEAWLVLAMDYRYKAFGNATEAKERR